ncbi:MAG TPA: hypothetical protein VK722_21525 [Candidatus Aquilonibacter sp.]|nr:hypothetical protein [Candidatus Aquilonibacter sp.]
MSRNSLLRSAPDLGPVDAVASARNLPVLALRGRGIKQARIPNERYGDYSAVAQGNPECVVREMHVQHSLICRYCRKIHSTPLEIALCADYS